LLSRITTSIHLGASDLQCLLVVLLCDRPAHRSESIVMAHNTHDFTFA